MVLQLEIGLRLCVGLGLGPSLGLGITVRASGWVRVCTVLSPCSIQTRETQLPPSKSWESYYQAC